MARSRELSKIFSSDTLVSLDNEIQNNIIIQAESEQTDNLLELRNSSGSVVSSIGPTGALTGIGKILQVVRATDTTSRSTSSTTFVDVTGMSVTITPKKSNSAVLLIFSASIDNPTNIISYIQITDSSNNAISGAEGGETLFPQSTRLILPIFLTAYATPATTSAVTYKVRFRVNAGGPLAIDGDQQTTQLYAIEVAA